MFLDTSAIVEIFRSPSGSSNFQKIMTEIEDDEALYVSLVQLAEIADWAIRNKAPSEERIKSVKEMARVVLLDEKICLEAATIKQRRRQAGHDGFGLIDGIILATARSIGQRVLTLDRDFAGEDDCTVIHGNR